MKLTIRRSAQNYKPVKILNTYNISIEKISSNKKIVEINDLIMLDGVPILGVKFDLTNCPVKLIELIQGFLFSKKVDLLTTKQRKCECGDIIQFDTETSCARSRHSNSKCFKCCTKQQEAKKRPRQSELMKGKNNPMYNVSIFDIWENKYSQKEFKKKKKEFSIKQSKNTSGKNNPMYGRPVISSGCRGYLGTYKGNLFRSLSELSYIVNVLEKENKKWKSAEAEKFHIEYKDENGKERTYTPDFIINNKTLVEIKPVYAVNEKNTLIKKKAAEKFCKKNKMKYCIITPNILGKQELWELYENGLIEFKIEKYKNNFIKTYSGYKI